MAQLRGPGGDVKLGLHHWQLPAERHHAAAGHPDGQIRSPPNPLDGQVIVAPVFSLLTGTPRFDTLMRLYMLNSLLDLTRESRVS